MSEVVDPALATAGKTCDLGTDPSKYLEKFEDWYEHTSLLADSIGVKDKKQKLCLLLLWGGRQFRKFAKEAKVTTEGDTPDTLEQAITKIREQCGAHVNLSITVYSDFSSVLFFFIIALQNHRLPQNYRGRVFKR